MYFALSLYSLVMMLRLCYEVVCRLSFLRLWWLSAIPTCSYIFGLSLSRARSSFSYSKIFSLYTLQILLFGVESFFELCGA